MGEPEALGRVAAIPGRHERCSWSSHMQHARVQVPLVERRLLAIRDLVRGLRASGADVDAIFRALAGTLTSTFADACAVRLGKLLEAAASHRDDPRDQLLAGLASDAELGAHELATEPPLPRFAPYIERFGSCALVVLPLGPEPLDGVVVVARRRAFDADDLAAIETCIGCTTMAAELAAERAHARAERGRIAAFQQEMRGVIAHDLRGPLNAMIIGCERLATANDNGVSAAAQIVSFTNRMSRTVEQLVEMTRTHLGARHESC